MSYLVGFLLPFVTIVFSYFALWRMVRSSSNSLRDSRFANIGSFQSLKAELTLSGHEGNCGL